MVIDLDIRSHQMYVVVGWRNGAGHGKFLFPPGSPVIVPSTNNVMYIKAG